MSHGGSAGGRAGAAGGAALAAPEAGGLASFRSAWLGSMIFGTGIPGLVNVYIANWKDPRFLMGKSTISMAIFNSFLYVYQMVEPHFFTSTEGFYTKPKSLGKL